MGNQHLLAEALVIGTGHYLRRNTGQITIVGAVFGCEHERNERGPCWLHFQSKLPGYLVSERRGSNFGDREASGCDDQGRRAKLLVFREDDKFRCPLDFSRRSADKDLHSMRTAFLLQHRGDVVGGTVAKKLAKSLFVVANTMFFDQGDEICWRVPRQCGFREVWIA